MPTPLAHERSNNGTTAMPPPPADPHMTCPPSESVSEPALTPPQPLPEHAQEQDQEPAQTSGLVTPRPSENDGADDAKTGGDSTTPAAPSKVAIPPLCDIPSPMSAEDAHEPLSASVPTGPEPSSSSVTADALSFYVDPFPKLRFLPNSSSSFLRPGSCFVGSQKSEKHNFEVQVELQHVDMADSFLCGYLRIQGLADDHHILTTYFEGEMIGTKYSFITKHPEWGSNEKVDMQHWGRFPAWRPLASQAKKGGMLKNFSQKENIFMRWKEYFLVPDHRVKNITGASFEGFYYICFNQVKGNISGIYFHAKSER